MRKYSLKWSPGLVFTLCLLSILCFFLPCFKPDTIFFSNDGPLGAVHASASEQPTGFTGLWFDLNTIGSNGGAYFVAFTPTLLWLLKPLLFAKFYAALAIMILGFCVWLGFRQLKFTPLACLLGSLGAMLNSTYFSPACWGVGPQAITAGMSFLAIGLLFSSRGKNLWIKIILAGFAVGMGVMEGFDIGAIYSLMVAAFVVFQAFATEGPAISRTKAAVGRLALVGISAGFLAFQAVTGLIGTQIKGVAGAEQDTRSKIERWDWATQWSLPKREILSLVIPGLFGNRMDTPGGGNYWGAIGRDPSWDRFYAAGKQGPPPPGMLRFSGGSFYAGVLVIVISVWSSFQGFRKQGSVFSSDHKKYIRFWTVVLIISLLLSLGRFAPFYQFVYALPYASTIRNPAKFLAILSFALVMLFAYGVDALSRRFMQNTALNAADRSIRFKLWWEKAARFDKRWVVGSVLAVVLSLLGWLVYANARPSLESYLQSVQFDETMARAIAGFSIGQVGWYILFLIPSVAMVIAIISGRFAGRRAQLGGVVLGLLLVVDLARANLPWLRFWDYKQKYATNAVIDFLREKPYEHRVAILPFQAPPQLRLLNDLYRIEWAQHHFQYYDVQSLDIVQMPRMPADLLSFERALSFDGTPNMLYRMTRRWQLTNTRYLLGAAGFLEVLNRQIDPLKQRFRIAQAFDVVPKPGIQNPTRMEEVTAVPKTDGQYAIFEFSGALPRAALYTNWQMPSEDTNALNELKTITLDTNELAFLKQAGTNDFITLKKLGSPSFDPEVTVLLADSLHLTPSSSPLTNQPAETVEFASYAPKRIVLRSKAQNASVLMLTDKFDPNWKVVVDGKSARLLRCNYIMQGVQVPAGSHTIEFRFLPPRSGLFISLAAIAIGFVLLGFLIWTNGEQETAAPAKVLPQDLETAKKAARTT